MADDYLNKLVIHQQIPGKVLMRKLFFFFYILSALLQFLLNMDKYIFSFNYFLFLFYSLLDKVPDGATFIILCFIIRSVDAVGFSAAMTSSFAVSAKVFPNNIATVLVSLVSQPLCKSLYVMWWN